MATSTPWGRSQGSKSYARGIVGYTTASHGGIHLSPTRNAAVHPAWRNVRGWYEEDSDYNVVVFTFPDYFEPLDVERAREHLRNNKPDAYMAVTGEVLTEADSWKLSQRALRAKHREDFVVLSAWGDWHANVPKGKVGVLACKGGRDEDYRSDRASESYFLVDHARYDEGRRSCSIGYVVDLEVDLPWRGPWQWP